ncbi:hypothetical protein V6N12_019827 [Hibiscus sabdariffa]|uniref:Uncharacterized protein n=1 Tax=Hibiscus sabdariffa TaxID=183260 RepID=A0ABR2ARI3_9ROSI
MNSEMATNKDQTLGYVDKQTVEVAEIRMNYRKGGWVSIECFKLISGQTKTHRRKGWPELNSRYVVGHPGSDGDGHGLRVTEQDGS